MGSLDGGQLQLNTTKPTVGWASLSPKSKLAYRAVSHWSGAALLAK